MPAQDVQTHSAHPALRRRAPMRMGTPARHDHPQGGLMSLQSRLESLKTRHASLERSIAAEDMRPLPNAEALSRLKREKLRLKEEMERTRGSLAQS